jgi:hypothetical protein
MAEPGMQDAELRCVASQAQAVSTSQSGHHHTPGRCRRRSGQLSVSRRLSTCGSQQSGPSLRVRSGPPTQYCQLVMQANCSAVVMRADGRATNLEVLRRCRLCAVPGHQPNQQL